MNLIDQTNFIADTKNLIVDPAIKQKIEEKK